MDYINRYKDNNFPEIDLLINSIIDSIPDALLITGLNNNISFFNNTFIQFWQIPKENFQIHDRDSVFKYLDSKLLKDGFFIKTMYYLNDFPYEATFNELELINGSFIECYTLPRWINSEIDGRIWSFRDISQQKRFEDTLQTQKQELINAHRIALLGSWTLDIKSKEFTYSESLSQMCEGLLAHKTFRTFIDAVHPDDLETVQNFFRKIEIEGINENTDLRYRVVGTRLYYLKTIVEVVFSNSMPKLILGVTQDITEQALLEISLDSAKEAAEDYNLAKGIFLSNMSHEMRTPLNAILGFSEILLQMQGDKLQKDYINSIKSSGEALLSLIEDILYITKVDGQKVKVYDDEVNIRNLFQEIYELFKFQFEEKGIKINIIIDENVPNYIAIDKARLKQILINLISNALKFTKSGFVFILASAKNNDKKGYTNISISIEDTGIGIAEKDIEKIFESFHQVDVEDKKSYKGVGLGLYITKKSVELLGGTIEVKSALNMGSVFIVTFNNLKIPLESFHINDQNIDSENIVFEPANILIAVDKDYNRKILKGFLSRFNFKISDVDNGIEAALMAEKFQPSIIILDLIMTKMDGYKALKAIRGNFRTCNIPIMAFSNDDKELSRERLLKIGFNDILDKPFSYSKILKLLCKFIPYKLSKNQTAIETESEFNDIIEKLLENKSLASSLDKRLFHSWKALSEKGSSKKQKEFAEKLEQFGIECGQKYLKELGSSLLDALSVYDIDKATEIMNKISFLFNKLFT
jgi:signal transduction histidine kinase/DNA-binding NarL/FixJ family response regulator